jgi:hypothetical protein
MWQFEEGQVADAGLEVVMECGTLGRRSQMRVFNCGARRAVTESTTWKGVERGAFKLSDWRARGERPGVPVRGP